MLPALNTVRKLYFYKLSFVLNVKIFGRKFEGVRFLTCESTETGAVTQIVVRGLRGHIKLLIVNLKDNTGLCHYVISVRKTSVVGSNKRELE